MIDVLPTKNLSKERRTENATDLLPWILHRVGKCAVSKLDAGHLIYVLHVTCLDVLNHTIVADILLTVTIYKTGTCREFVILFDFMSYCLINFMGLFRLALLRFLLRFCFLRATPSLSSPLGCSDSGGRLSGVPPYSCEPLQLHISAVGAILLFH